MADTATTTVDETKTTTTTTLVPATTTTTTIVVNETSGTEGQQLDNAFVVTPSPFGEPLGILGEDTPSDPVEARNKVVAQAQQDAIQNHNDSIEANS